MKHSGFAQLMAKLPAVRKYAPIRETEKVDEMLVIKKLVNALAAKYSAWKNEPSNSDSSNG